jgi:D-alanyl-D-alanine carboxypeptidase
MLITISLRAGRLLVRSSRFVLLVSAICCLSACDRSETRSNRENAAVSAGPALDTVAIRDTVERLAKEMLVPGAVVILRTPNGEFKHVYGVTSYRGTTPTSFDQHIRVGSNTKTWTGTVILQLVQEGKLNLADPVAKYRPDVPNGANITIEQLLTMHSGLYNYTETLEINRALDEQPQKAWTPEQLLTLAFKHPPLFAPGSKFSYSNTNTVLLGLIAEQIDGKPLAEIMRDRLFKPLGLANTLLPPNTMSTLPEPYAHGYMYGTNVLTMDTLALPDSLQRAARAGTLAPADQSNVNPSWAGAAGAGISSANDLITWVQALVSGKMLNADLQARRLASVRPIDPSDAAGASYGWAIAKFGEMYGHTGELPGYNSFMAHDPVNNITLVVWANLAPTVDGRDAATTIARSLILMLYAQEDDRDQ